MAGFTNDQAFNIDYHMSWPSGADPWYLANQDDNNGRRYYYGVNSTPTMKCDGGACSTTQSGILSAVNARRAIASNIWLDLDATLNGNTLQVTCTAVSSVNITGSVKLHLVLLERYKYLASPNGSVNHEHAMLDMSPSYSGQAFNVTANDTNYFYGSFPMSATWDLANLDIACFVQNDTNREILQAHCEEAPVNFPGLYYEDYTLQDNGNNDGRAEPGETAYMYITLGNQPAYQTATNVVGTLTSTDPDLNFTTSTVNYPDIPNGGSGTNANPFVFEVAATAQPHLTTLQLEVVADPAQTVYTTDIDIYIGWPEILLVDDDGVGIMETYYQSTLDNLGRTYEDWDINVLGVPPLSVAAGYPLMIWFTGFVSTDPINTSERNLIEDYLDQGGSLFISGQNIAQGLNTSSPTFLSNVLLASLGTVNTQNKVLNGVAGDPVGDGLSVDCNAGGSGSGTCTHPDGIYVLTPASEAFLFSTGTYYGGLTYEHTGGGKVVFFSFPFEAISGQSATNTREEVGQAILDWVLPSSYPDMVVDLTYVSGSPVPAGGGNLYFDVYLENTSGAAQDFDAWVESAYEGGDPVTLVMRSFTNYQAGWAVNRPNTWFPIPGGWAAGNYTLTGKAGDHPNVAWAQDGFPFVKSGVADGSAFVPWAVDGAPNPFDKIDMNGANPVLPEGYSLLSCHPNPFNPTTTISYALEEAGLVKLAVYDISGREVATLVDGQRNAGMHEAVFDASSLASGVYLYKLTTASQTAISKMILMK